MWEVQANLQIRATKFSDNTNEVKTNEAGNNPSSLVFHNECPSGYEGSLVKGAKLITSGYNILGLQHSFSGSTCRDASSSSSSSSPSVDPGHHFWDFRGCTTGATVAVSVSKDLMATPINGATFSSDGIILDGYDDIDDWEWGGAKSIKT